MSQNCDSPALLHYLSYTVFQTAWEIWVTLWKKNADDPSIPLSAWGLDEITAQMRHYVAEGKVEEREEQCDRGLVPIWKLTGEAPQLIDPSFLQSKGVEGSERHL